MFKKIMHKPVLWNRLVAFVLLSSYACFAISGGDSGPSGKGGGGTKDPAAAPFVGLSFKVENSTTPPGGIFQYQLMLTEPKPIGHGSTRPTVPSGPVRGIALNDPIGQTVGVAVVNDSGIQINFDSPNAAFGTNPDLDFPILTIAFPIAQNAVEGKQFPISIDLPESLFTDPSGQPYAQKVENGKLTIGGTLAISDVVPNVGVQPAGAKISIIGVGFTPDARVNIANADLSPHDVHFVSPTQMDVVLPVPLQMDALRVRVTNQTERSIYFSYFRALVAGASTHALVAQSYALFSHQLFTGGTLPWTRAGQQFTALALQNPTPDAVNVTIEMLSATGETLGSTSLPVPPLSKLTRDLMELFANPPEGAVAVQITPSQPIQMLGLLGDDATSKVLPVIVSAQ